MERTPIYVQYIKDNKELGGLILLTNRNRHYWNQMINVHKIPNYVYCDENKSIIGDVEFSPQDAEVYVEHRLKELIEREDSIIKREADSMQKEFDLTEREGLLNEREAKLNIAENTKANSDEITKVDKKSKE